MAEKSLHIRSVAAVGRELGDCRVTSISETIHTDCVQITDDVAVSDVIGDTTAKDLGGLSK
jgi:hypothetical protein